MESENVQQSHASACPSTSKSNKPTNHPKKEKRGIIYLSFIPPGLNPRNARSFLGRFGEIDRIYFEPSRFRKGLPVEFKEGWIEYKKKRVAKHVAKLLDGTVIACRKRAPFSGNIWSMKYLHRVKWHHLSEQVNVEKAAKDQRLRLEMGLVKKETDFYEAQAERLKRIRKKGEEEPPQEVLERRKQYYSEKQHRSEDNKTVTADSLKEELLDRIFS